MPPGGAGPGQRLIRDAAAAARGHGPPALTASRRWPHLLAEPFAEVPPTVTTPPGYPADFVPLRTDRLTLRPLRAEDATALHRLVNDWEVAKTLARVPFPYKRSLADEWILSTWAQIAAGEAWHLAIVGEEPGPDGPAETLIGCVALTLDADRRQAELGYWVGRRYWGHGVATEAAGRLCRWALAQSRDHRHPCQRPAGQCPLRRRAAPARLPPGRGGDADLPLARRPDAGATCSTAGGRS